MPVTAVKGLGIVSLRKQAGGDITADAYAPRPDTLYMSGYAHAPGDGGNVGIWRPVKRENTRACLLAAICDGEQAVILGVVIENAGNAIVGEGKGNAHAVGRPDRMGDAAFERQGDHLHRAGTG